ncbi:MAG: hypothetical protein AAF579_02705 [Cyanobacteria bacterium P01_C01_bin.118]
MLHTLKFMEPLVASKILFSGLIRRFWPSSFMQGLTLGMSVLIFATNVNTGMNTVTPVAKANPPSPVVATSPLPSVATKVRLRPRLVTGAAMTSHSLTDAHLFSRRPTGKISAKNNEKSKQG